MLYMTFITNYRTIIRSAASVLHDFKIDKETHLPSVLHRTANMLLPLIDCSRYRIYLVTSCRTKIVHSPPIDDMSNAVMPRTWNLGVNILR